MTDLSPRGLDRAAGVLLGAACGDALGVPYEFDRPPGPDEEPAMLGGGLGPYAPGEYSDDTQMAVCIAKVAMTGADLREEQALDQVAAGFLEWAADGASDMGSQTRAVLDEASGQASGPAAALRAAARSLHERTGRTAGNGSLMRTGPVALAYLDDPVAMAEAARAVSDLTHPDPLAGEACVLWCAAIRRAVLDATFDGLAEGLDLLPADRRTLWSRHIAQARVPAHFSHNGFVVTALQAAWSAVAAVPVPGDHPAGGVFACQHLRHALAAAIRIGDDTDTVAAIAGALLGARWGASAIPLEWVRLVHGWPGLRAADLVWLSVLAATGGRDNERGWPSLARRPEATIRAERVVPHPDDDGVLLGSLGLPGAAADAVDAVVSLCEVGREDFAWVPPGDHVQVWLVDHSGDNNQPHFVIDQAARAVASLRAEGKRVFLHCHAGRSRTPVVAARYAVITRGTAPAEALDRACAALGGPLTAVNPELRAALNDLTGG